jgi:hypothetical protein
VRPENIFYTFHPAAAAIAAASDADPEQQQQQQDQPPQPGYHFRLGGFHLCEHESALSSAPPDMPQGTAAGATTTYLAPELLAPFAPQRRHGPTHKSDVWALAVTWLWTLDADVGDKLEMLFSARGFTEAVAVLLEVRGRGMRAMVRLDEMMRVVGGMAV